MTDMIIGLIVCSLAGFVTGTALEYAIAKKAIDELSNDNKILFEELKKLRGDNE